jgi:hypothetical protein
LPIDNYQDAYNHDHDRDADRVVQIAAPSQSDSSYYADPTFSANQFNPNDIGESLMDGLNVFSVQVDITGYPNTMEASNFQSGQHQTHNWGSSAITTPSFDSFGNPYSPGVDENIVHAMEPYPTEFRY